MPSKAFESLQKKHQNLLQRQLSPSENDKLGLSKDVKDYITQCKAAGENVSLIEEREQLRANLRYWANYIYGIEGIWPDTDLPETVSNKKLFPTNGTRRFVASAIVVILIILVAIVVQNNIGTLRAAPVLSATVPVQTATALSTATSPIVGYGFDNNPMGWVPETRLEAQAIYDVGQEIKFGKGSLVLKIELIGNNPEKSKGEVFVNLSSNPPLEETETAPLDLEGKPINVVIYAPWEAIGIPSNPNGIQIFVRDSNDRSQYGVWTNLAFDNTNEWISVTWLPSLKTTPEEESKGASTDDGFDPSKINIIGLKIGAGDAFDKSFIGSIWIDEVTWP